MATRLKITSLKFISAVDAGAQGPISNVALVKRAPTGDEFSVTCKVAKLDEALGVVFGYAVASTVDGGASPHIDLQGDAVVGGDELIKVALGFVEAGALSDVMHDEKNDGFVPFVFPLTKDTKAALGITSDVEGIAIGMKPSTETFKRFVSGELAAFSIGGTGIREPLEKAKIAKAALYTDEVDGHQHKICVYDDGAAYCEDATSEGAAEEHSHGVMCGPDGSLAILMSSGHTHQLAAGQPALVVVEPGTTVVVAARAPLSKSTRPHAVGNVNAQPEPMIMKTDAEKLADLQKSHDRLERIAKMSGGQKIHFDTLTGDRADEFLAKSDAERDAVVTAELAKRADAEKIVYTAKSDGAVYRAKDDVRLVDMAKRMDAQAEAIEKADIRKAAAACLGNVAGTDEVHDYIVKSIRKGGGDAAMIDAAIKSLSSANEFAKSVGKAAGFGGTEPSEDEPLAKFNTGLAAFAKTIGKAPNAATGEFLRTPAGADLYAAARPRAGN